MLTLGASVLSFSLVGRPAARGGVPRMAAGDAALIIQNKGGGHGEIGYHLALQLVKEMGMEVTVLHEGPNKGKPPHNAYGDLDAAGVKVIWCDDLKDSAACLGALGGASFGAVVDNWSKSPEDIAPYADAATAWGVKHYAYVSSAGMYTPAKGEFGAITEMCAVKSSGQRQARAPSHLPRPCLAPASHLPRTSRPHKRRAGRAKALEVVRRLAVRRTPQHPRPCRRRSCWARRVCPSAASGRNTSTDPSRARAILPLSSTAHAVSSTPPTRTPTRNPTPPAPEAPP